MGENDLLLGHGPRLMAEIALDVRTLRLGVEAPKRFGVFASVGAANLAGRNTPFHWTGTIEAGLRWRIQ